MSFRFLRAELEKWKAMKSRYKKQRMIADYKILGTTSFSEVNFYPQNGMVPSTCSPF